MFTANETLSLPNVTDDPVLKPNVFSSHRGLAEEAESRPRKGQGRGLQTSPMVGAAYRFTWFCWEGWGGIVAAHECVEIRFAHMQKIVLDIAIRVALWGAWLRGEYFAAMSFCICV